MTKWKIKAAPRANPETSAALTAIAALPTTQAGKKAGRPPLPEGEAKSERFELRLSPADRAKLVALGGTAWVVAKIQKAKTP